MVVIFSFFELLIFIFENFLIYFYLVSIIMYNIVYKVIKKEKLDFKYSLL